MAADRAGGIASFIARRLLSAVQTVFMVLVIGFVVTRLAPGDPVTYLAGEQAPPEMIAEIKAKYLLDRPYYVQFGHYLLGLAKGDLGYSFAYRQGVGSLILERVPATLLLVGSSIAIALTFGIALALLAVRFLNRALDRVLSAVSMIGYSVPVFWLAQLLMFFMAVKLDLFPAGGMQDLRAPSAGFAKVLDLLHHLALPALNLGLIYMGLIARLTRAEMAEVLTMDFVLTARAKGVPERTVLVRHALKNALAPIITMTGVLVGTMFAGAIFTETIFSWPGLGRLLYDSLFARDYPVITAMFVLTSVTLVVVNLAVDLLYSFVDPRVRAA